MQILVLGGTVFLSRAVAEEALRRGHDVTCLARGHSGSVPHGARAVVVDRDAASPEELRAAASTGSSYGPPEVVVDVARKPSHVQRAVAAWPDAHWVFVSTCSVYAEHRRPGGTVDTTPVLLPVATDEDPSTDPNLYGAMKVACERFVHDGTASSMSIRAGLIVGPGDPSGRFTYWPARIADGGEVLAPASPDDAVQVIDVRDLAVWIVDCAEAGRTGVYDGISPPVSRRTMLEEIAQGVASPGSEHVEFTWVPSDFLVRHKVEEWAGPRSLPLWIADPGWHGFMARDTSSAVEAGLRTRSFAETARDTLAWLRETPDAKVTGLTRAEESEVLGAWHTLGA